MHYTCHVIQHSCRVMHYLNWFMLPGQGSAVGLHSSYSHQTWRPALLHVSGLCCQVKEALLDYTRAIHIRPDVQHYYMYRVYVARSRKRCWTTLELFTSDLTSSITTCIGFMLPGQGSAVGLHSSYSPQTWRPALLHVSGLCCQVKEALLDYTRAIHLRPDVQHYYMYRVRIITVCTKLG